MTASDQCPVCGTDRHWEGRWQLTDWLELAVHLGMLGVEAIIAAAVIWTTWLRRWV